MSKPWDKIRVMPQPLPPSSYPIGPGSFEIGMGINVKVRNINHRTTRPSSAAPGAYVNVGDCEYWYPSEMREAAAFFTELADQIENKNG